MVSSSALVAVAAAVETGVEVAMTGVEVVAEVVAAAAVDTTTTIIITTTTTKSLEDIM
ncbi:hypothetical protein KDA_59780 [Dictyobacter alpinus]|uniref:Uncharacterized protein n=1 Tax=Dictyobacter alpinus TaxID=2014873 RepID=A0A402BGF3_9CHLR|nr:hypothetical protein KDA_59780 [Dictyobacter alpinus]